MNIRPRLRLTSYCNKNCPYCFAENYLELSKEDLKHLTVTEIRKLCNQFSHDGIKSVAWQGGEPMIHPNISEIIKLHKKYNIAVQIFTNGIFDESIIQELKDLDFTMLINFNHPLTYSNKNDFDTVIKNIESFVEEDLKDRIALGYNFYGDKPDYQFFLETISKYGLRSVRIDMVRPSVTGKNEHYKFNDINSTFDDMKEMMEKCKEAGAYFSHFDCPFPLCELTNENRLYAWRHFPTADKLSACSTHIDISPGLEISSCFCSSKFEDVYLEDFKDIKECWQFINYFESKLRWDVKSQDKCNNCIYNDLKICQGGCIGYKKSDSYKLLNKSHIEEFRLSNTHIINELSHYDSKSGFVNYIINSPYPLYTFFKEMDVVFERFNFEYDELSKIITNITEKYPLVKDINEYYENLILGEFSYLNKQYEESFEFFSDAYQRVNYLDIKYLLTRFIEIDKFLNI